MKPPKNNNYIKKPTQKNNKSPNLFVVFLGPIRPLFGPQKNPTRDPTRCATKTTTIWDSLERTFDGSLWDPCGHSWNPRKILPKIRRKHVGILFDVLGSLHVFL